MSTNVIKIKKIIVSMLVTLLLLNIVALSTHGREAVGQSSFNLGSQIHNSPVDDFKDSKSNFSEILAGYDLPIDVEFPYFVPGELIVKFSKDTSIYTSVSPDGVIHTGVESIDELNREYAVTDAEELFGKNPDSAADVKTAVQPTLRTSRFRPRCCSLI